MPTCFLEVINYSVIPAQAGIQCLFGFRIDSRLRGNDSCKHDIIYRPANLVSNLLISKLFIVLPSPSDTLAMISGLS